jgi:hypothetical protein
MLCAMLFGYALPVRASEGTVQFFSNLNVPADGQVTDAVCVFCSITVDGKVTGDVVAIFGNVKLSGDAQHDVVNIFGNIQAEKGSSIEGDVVSVFGLIRLGERVTVGQDLTSILSSVDSADSAAVLGNRTIVPGYVFFVPLGILVLIVFVVVREIRAQKRMRALRGFPVPPVR